MRASAFLYILAIASPNKSRASFLLIFIVGVKTTPTSNSLSTSSKLPLTFSREFKFASFASLARSLSIALVTSGCFIYSATVEPVRFLALQNLVNSSGSGNIIATI